MKKALKNQKPIRLKKKKKRSKLGKILIITFYSITLFCLIAGFTGAGFIYFHYSQDLPDVRELKIIILVPSPRFIRMRTKRLPSFI